MTTPNDHRRGACHNCNGEGRTEDYDSDDETATVECEDCDGEGDALWAWDLWDTCECSRCHAEAPCAGWGEDGDDPVCWPCAVEAHAAVCGCGDVTWVVTP